MYIIDRTRWMRDRPIAVFLSTEENAEKR